MEEEKSFEEKEREITENFYEKIIRLGSILYG